MKKKNLMKLRVFTFAVFFIGLFLLLANSETQAQVSCSQVQPNVNYYGCGIPTEEFEYMRSVSVNKGSQIQTNWCWAACVQMILNYHGLYVSQTDVVSRIYGSPYVNKPANEEQTLTALSGWAFDVRGSYSSIHASSGHTSVEEIITMLSLKHPLFVGLDNPNSDVGHAYVLTGIYFSYQFDNYGRVIGYLPQKVVLRDPFPGNQSRVEMSWSDFESRINMAIKVWITRG